MSRRSKWDMDSPLQLAADHANVFLVLFPMSTSRGKLVSPMLDRSSSPRVETH